MKKLLQALAPVFRPGYSDTALLFLRLAGGGMLITHGMAKVMNYGAMSASFPDMTGLGGAFSFTLIMLAESLGSLFVMLGLLTRAAALAVAFGMGVAAFVAHAPFTLSGSELPLLYMFIFITILISGGGRYSLDRMIWPPKTGGQ